MSDIQLSRGNIIAGILTCWLVFTVCAVNGWNPFGMQYVLGIPLLFLVPGFLTLTLLRVRIPDMASRTVLAVGISVLELMAIGLLSNTVMPYFGVARPLDSEFIVWGFSTLLFVLLAMASWRLKPIIVLSSHIHRALSRNNAPWIIVPIVLVCTAALGAIEQNTGGTNTVTMLTLLVLAAFAYALFRRIDALEEHVVSVAMYLLSLTVLLMTSLRGTFIAGHDIQREFFVFQLAKEAGIWSMQAYVDAYNACLSITILPTMLANMLHVSDPLVYKVVMQIVFATTGVVAYLIARKWLTPRLAFLAGIVFIAFPTFFQDMPFLIRQEVAFLFYGLMVYVLFSDHVSQRLRSTLVVLLGIGVVLSHYSTTYTILFVLLLTTISTPILFRVVRYLRAKRLFQDSALGSPIRETPLPIRRVSIPMVLTLTTAALLWTSVITETDAHVRDVVGEIWTAVTEGVDGQSHSADVLTLFSLGRVQHEYTLDDYIEQSVMPRRAVEPDAYYATSTYAHYELTTVPRFELPYTSLGAMPSEDTAYVGKIVTFMGQLLAKLIQATLLIGLVYVIFRRRWVHRMDVEYFVLAGYALFFILLCIILPVLSIEYGLFRALQQSFFILAPLLVVGLLVVGSLFAWLSQRWCRFLLYTTTLKEPCRIHPEGVAAVLAVTFLLYATGFMTQLVGGNIPPVHLNSVGDDYDHYVTVEAERDAIEWLVQQLDADRAQSGTVPVVHADRYGQKKIRAFVLSRVDGTVFPGAVLQDAYVFVGPAILERGVATVNYEGSLIKYRYPIEFLDENKDVVYDNGAVRIYK